METVGISAVEQSAKAAESTLLTANSKPVWICLQHLGMLGNPEKCSMAVL